MTEKQAPDQGKAEKTIQVIAKFKADLLWDDIVGVFDLVAEDVKNQLNNQYEQAIKAAAAELNVSSFDLRQQVEDFACTMINGQIYSKEDVRARLREYGVEVDVESL